MCCLVLQSNFALLLTIQFALLISSLINIISLLLTTFDWTEVRGIAPLSHTGRPRTCLVNIIIIICQLSLTSFYHIFHPLVLTVFLLLRHEFHELHKNESGEFMGGNQHYELNFLNDIVDIICDPSNTFVGEFR